MCGIAGFWKARGAGEDELRAPLAAMTDALRHRGPDDAGQWFDPAAGLALGHRRLSILDLSAEGRQPMADPSGRFVLVFNGEIYNFAELRADLEPAGVRFRGHSDSEVLLHALVRWGVERTIERCVGMFAFALWDAAERELVLARDRLGIKPLYWGLQGSGAGRQLWFASELKALRAHPAFAAELDRDALALYFRHNYVPDPHTVYRDVRKLPPGHCARVRASDGGPGDPMVRPYWSAREVAARGVAAPRSVGFEEALDELERVLGTSVRQRMVADVPLGAFLSGGIDSSVVVALMQAASERPVRTFTIGFQEDGYDEARHAAAVARHLGTDHRELTVTPAQAREVIPDLATFWDEPFSDSSQIPTYLVSRLAREDVTVSLSGDGGDELFGGYRRYALAERAARRVFAVPRPVRRAASAALAAVPAPALEGVERLTARPRGGAQRTVERALRLLGHASDQSLYLSMVSHWKRPEELVVGAREPASVLLDPTLRQDLPDLVERLMYLDTVTYLPGDILTKVDRASMAVGLEARVPLLDHRVVELAWSLPKDVRVGPAPGKRLLRGLLERYVPRSITDRPKMGFGVPMPAWLRGPLREWADELLSSERLAAGGVLHGEPIRTRWEEHRDGRANWGYPLWDVLVLQAWRERWGL